MPFEAGHIIGDYEVLGPLGAGGIGEVYRAKDTRLEREVALKTLSLERCSQPEALSRFEQEARSACALNHPNIVTIYSISQGCRNRGADRRRSRQSARDWNRSSRFEAGESDGLWRRYRQDSGFRPSETAGG